MYCDPLGTWEHARQLRQTARPVRLRAQLLREECRRLVPVTAKANSGVIVYIHFGNNYMRETFPAVPKVGEIIEFLGEELAVVRVEYDGSGRAHLYVEHSSAP